MNTQELQNDKLNIIRWISELQDYSVVEKIKAIMSTANDDIPQWQKDILDKRLNDCKKNPDKFKPIEELFDALDRIIEDDDNDFELTADMKAVLDERLQEDENTYLSAEESLNQLHKKYGL